MKTINNKGISTVAIVLIVVIVLLAGGAVWWGVSRNTNSNSNQNNIDNLNANGSINNNTARKNNKYTNNTYGFSVTYPYSWELVEKSGSSNGYINEKWLVSIDKISKTGSYPDPKRPLDLSVGIGIIDNTDNRTLDQLFEKEYEECKKDENNVMGCPRTFYGIRWKESIIDGHQAFRSGIVGPIIDNDNVFIRNGNYYLHINGFYYKQNSDTIKEFEEILSSLKFN